MVSPPTSLLCKLTLEKGHIHQDADRKPELTFQCVGLSLHDGRPAIRVSRVTTKLHHRSAVGLPCRLPPICCDWFFPTTVGRFSNSRIDAIGSVKLDWLFGSSMFPAAAIGGLLDKLAREVATGFC